MKIFCEAAVEISTTHISIYLNQNSQLRTTRTTRLNSTETAKCFLIIVETKVPYYYSLKQVHEMIEKQMMLDILS